MYARAVGVAALDSELPFLLSSPPRIRVKNECVQVCERARWRLVNAGGSYFHVFLRGVCDEMWSVRCNCVRVYVHVCACV